MSKGARLAIVAGIIIAIGAVAAYAAISATESVPTTQPDDGNSTDREPREIVVELDENLNVEAK